MYYSHNLHFVAYARMMQGNLEGAMDYAKRLTRNVDGHIDAMPMLAPYGTFEWLVLARFNKWNEILAYPEPKEKTPYLQAMYRYARGLAFAGMGKVRKAQAEREKFAAIVATVAETDMLMINSAKSVLAIAQADLDARVARAGAGQDGATETEISHLRKAVELQDKLAYMEPPEWHYSMREALGGALLRSGDYVEAERVFRKDLELHPRNARSLFGLLKALELQKKTDSVEWVKLEFAEAWKHASSTLRVGDL
jgi:tetratricopeptide (TPR) repeat protein